MTPHPQPAGAYGSSKAGSRVGGRASFNPIHRRYDTAPSCAFLLSAATDSVLDEAPFDAFACQYGVRRRPHKMHVAGGDYGTRPGIQDPPSLPAHC